MSDLADLRENYAKQGLSRDNLAAAPLTQLRQWLDEAIAAEVREPNAMMLATVSPEGQARTRTVLLKGLDERGLVFYTNYSSEKATHLGQNPRVSVLFLWLDLERQVSVEGTVERVSTAESLAYFASRPIGSRLGAWTSPQSQVVSSRQLLEMKLAEMKRKFADGKVPLPDFWGGFRIKPTRFEFWQGRPNRLHDRFEYQPSPEAPDTWSIQRLAP